MGIRIQKSLGYGFDDLVPNDPRINWEHYEEAIEHTAEDFNIWLSLIKTPNLGIEIGIFNLSAPKKWNLYDAVVYDAEFGLDQVFQIVDVGFRDQWVRRDDGIDYVEAMLKGDGAAIPECNRLESSIYPFTSDVSMHINTGKTINSNELRWKNDLKCDIFIDSETILSYSEDRKFEFVPIVPKMTSLLAEYVGVKKEFIPTMRPLLYTFWS